MRHQCHGGKWSEDEVRAKRLRKNKTTRWTSGETYRGPVRAPICEMFFERIKARLKGCNNGVHSGKMIIKKNGASMTLDTRKSQNKNMMFYLKAKIYAPEGQ